MILSYDGLSFHKFMTTIHGWGDKFIVSTKKYAKHKNCHRSI
jgi:hypothetical protein